MARKNAKQAVAELYDDIFPAGDEAPEKEVSTRVDTPKTDKRRGIKKRMTRSELEPWEGNPRGERSEEELHEMGASLEEHGQLQSLLTRPHPDPGKRALGIEQVVAGVTRFLAGAAPFGDFPIYDVDSREMDDREALDAAYAENAKRNEMPALDHARYFARRMAMEGGGEDSFRKVANASKFTHERIRQFVSLLSLPGLTENYQIEPGSILGEFQRLKLNEKHGRALLTLQGFPDAQLSLLRQIERTALSGNAAIDRAKTMLNDERASDEREKTASQKSVEKSSSAQKGNADDADFAASDAALASRDHETRGQKAGSGGVGSTAPVSSGSGFATASGDEQNLKPISLIGAQMPLQRARVGVEAANLTLSGISISSIQGGESYQLGFLKAEHKRMGAEIARIAKEIDGIDEKADKSAKTTKKP